jgi:hypothetical protein
VDAEAVAPLGDLEHFPPIGAQIIQLALERGGPTGTSHPEIIRKSADDGGLITRMAPNQDQKDVLVIWICRECGEHGLYAHLPIEQWSYLADRSTMETERVEQILRRWVIATMIVVICIALRLSN